MGIGPISGGGAYWQPEHTPQNVTQLIQEMEHFEQELRNLMSPPFSQAKKEKLDQLLQKMQAFLEQHGSELKRAMENNGWKTSGPYNCLAMFNSCIGAIKSYLEHPDHPNEAALDFLNESLTEVNWYLNHSVT